MCLHSILRKVFKRDHSDFLRVRFEYLSDLLACLKFFSIALGNHGIVIFKGTTKCEVKKPVAGQLAPDNTQTSQMLSVETPAKRKARVAPFNSAQWCADAAERCSSLEGSVAIGFDALLCISITLLYIFRFRLQNSGIDLAKQDFALNQLLRLVCT